MTDDGPFASDSDVIVLVPCPRCGATSSEDTTRCPSCGSVLGGRTALDDVHSVETVLLGARGIGARASHGDTTPDAEAFPSEPPTKIDAPAKSATVHPLPESSDESQVTAERPHELSPAPPPRDGWSSSDPPTRMMRGTEHHIELPNGSVVDDYEIEARLGEGAMGVVYGARHAKLGRRVAIKVIAPTIGADPQAIARFEREAKALASLHHPNIVDVYALGTLPDGRSYMVMEHLVGETLDDRLERGRVPLDEALDILDQMARALEGAHAQGIVHRDLKPANTYLVRLPQEQRSLVKLLDFGLVKLAVSDGLERTASNAVIGTALYLSPEQTRGPNVDGRTDVYALGCIAYELVLGRHPFPEARTPIAAIAAHLTEPAPPPRTIWPGIPAALDLLLHSMLAKDPNYRPSLAQARNVIAGVHSSATTARRAERRSTEATTVNARILFAALVALALVVGIAIGSRGRGGPSETAVTRTKVPVIDAPRAMVEQVPRANTGVTITPLDENRVVDSQPSPPLEKPPAAPAPRHPPEHPEHPDASQGALTLDSKPWTDVLVDGERRGRTPIIGLRLPLGQHKITLINATYAINETLQVSIKADCIETKSGCFKRLFEDYSDSHPR